MPATPEIAGDLTADEQRRVDIFRRASVSVVHIANIAVRQNLFSFDVLQMRGRPHAEAAGRLVVLENRAAIGAGELTGAHHDGVEHPIQVQRRADGAADFAEGGELVDGASEVTRPLLQLRQQTRVLDRDDRLVGERLE